MATPLQNGLNEDNKMTDEVKKGAEQASAQEEVEKEGAEASAAKELTSDDTAALVDALKRSLEREEKLAEERDNYKEGLLKAKGKLKSDDGAGEEGGEAAAGDANTSSDLVDVVKLLLKREKELITAVTNKSQVATTGQGSGSETKVTVGDNLLSQSQVDSLKGKGWDDAKIARLKQNLKNTRA